MSKKIGSLFYEIGADTSKFKKGLGDSKNELQKSANGLRDFGAAATKAFGFATAELAILKKAFDFGKEIAQVDFTQQKFENLAQTIGTTSDVIIDKLRSATKGLVSDMELAAAATDFLSLGLVKNEDDLIRLTRVAGELGMNMNQLVLTLTNQTTMRFDALGVSTAGFEEKVKSLEAAGLSASEAFTQAFLQQAEEQLATVGSAADSAIGSFQRLEASVKNLTDEMKQELLPVLTNAADGAYYLFSMNKNLTQIFMDHNKEVKQTSETYQDYIDEVLRSADAGGLLTSQEERLLRKFLEGEDVKGQAVKTAERLAEKLNIISESTFTAAKATSGWTEETYAAYRGLSTMDSAVVDVTESLETINGMLGDAGVLMQDYSDKLLFSAASAGMSAEEQIALAGAMGLVNGNTQYALEKVREYTVQLENGKITQQEYNDLVANLAGLMAALQDRDITVRVHAQIDSALNDYIGAGFGNQGTGQMTPQLQAGGGPAGSAFYWGEYGRSEIAFGRYGGGGAQVVNPQQLMEMIRSTIGGQAGGDTYNINITSNDSVGLAAYGAQMAKSKAMARI